MCSTTRAYIDEETEKLMQRRARNPITGKSELIDNISYSEWIKRYDNSNKTAKTVEKVALSSKKTPENNNKVPNNIKIGVNNNQLKSPNYDINSHNIKLRDIETPGDIIYNEFVKNGYENVGLVDKNNKIIGGIHTDNQFSSVGYSDKQLNIMKNKHRELTSIHTHPSNETFSIEDIIDSIDREAIRDIIVETPDYEFYLKPELETLNNAKENIIQFEKWFRESIGEFNDKNFEKFRNLNSSQKLDSAYEYIFNLIGWEYGKRKK